MKQQITIFPKGFTLIELLVVVLIITILTVVAVPQYQKAVKRAQGREVLNVINAIDKGLSLYALEHDDMQDATENSLDIEIPQLKHFQFQMGSWETHYLYLHGNLQMGTTTGELATIRNPDGSIYIRGSWTPDGKTTWSCWTNDTGMPYYNGRVGWASKPAHSCADYFDCGAEFEYHPQVTSSGTVIPAHYTGGSCRLK